ncbi:PEGA domain-containing protein [bacterium]|jgi:hypothetical protein|nr:PEGA domain-containing protein [bacterium]
MKYLVLFSLVTLSIFALTSCENEAPVGQLTVTALPGSYEIIIDNEPTGFFTPHSFMLPMGTHTVLVNAEGLEFAPAIEEIIIDTSPMDIEFRQMDSLFVDSSPQGAEVTVNARATLDEPIITPVTLDLPVGDYSISVTTYGYSTETTEITLTGDGSASLSFELEYLLSGELFVDSTPQGAAITLDSALTGEVTPFTFTTTAEMHEVYVFLEGYELPEVQQVVVPGESSITAHFDLQVLMEEPQKFVLIEGFSNVNCLGCGESNENIHHLLTTPGYENVALIKYATNWPAPNDPHYLANPADNTDRLDFYQPTHLPTWGIPTVMVDGVRSGSAGVPYDLAGLTALVDQQLAETPGFTIDVDADFSGGTIPVTVTLTAAHDIPANENAVLRVALCENPINYDEPPGTEGETEFHWIMREFELVSETPLPLSAGVPVEFVVQFNSNSEWVTENMIAVAFVQDDSQIDPELGSVMQTGFSATPALFYNNSNASFERGSE